LRKVPDALGVTVDDLVESPEREPTKREEALHQLTRILQAQCLNRELFANVEEAQVVVEAWREEYNGDRMRSLVARTVRWGI